MRSLIVIILILFSIVSFANDSTLYKKRIQKIKAFYEWLVKRPFEKINIYKADTNHVNWESYDTAINKFFDKNLLDSLYEKRGNQDDIFSTSAKFQLLKQSIANFHELTRKQCFDSLKFKQAEPYLKNSVQTKEDSLYLRTNIIQFFLLDGKEIHWNGFAFFDESDTLLNMPFIGLPEKEYKIFKIFYDRLKPCQH